MKTHYPHMSFKIDPEAPLGPLWLAQDVETSRVFGGAIYDDESGEEVFLPSAPDAAYRIVDLEEIVEFLKELEAERLPKGATS